MKRRYMASAAFPGPPEALLPACHRDQSKIDQVDRRASLQRWRPLGATAEEDFFASFYWRSFRMAWGCALACDRMDTPACCRTCSFVKFVISAAMLTSTSPLTAEERFWL